MASIRYKLVAMTKEEALRTIPGDDTKCLPKTLFNFLMSEEEYAEAQRLDMRALTMSAMNPGKVIVCTEVGYR